MPSDGNHTRPAAPSTHDTNPTSPRLSSPLRIPPSSTSGSSCHLAEYIQIIRARGALGGHGERPRNIDGEWILSTLIPCARKRSLKAAGLTGEIRSSTSDATG